MRLPQNKIIVGDALQVLRTLPDDAIDCVVTSPPYYALRHYGMSEELGQETNVDGWVKALRQVAREIARVIAPYGAFWLNLGDSYAQCNQDGAPPGSLLLGPERLARALLEDGWRVRNRVAWVKSNPLPSSVRNRLTCSWEHVYLLVRTPRYYFDLDSIREPMKTTKRRGSQKPTPPEVLGRLAASRDGLVKLAREGRNGHPLGKNPTDAWVLPVGGYRGEHPATFPPGLVRRPIMATCPERVCTRCKQPWRRSLRQVLYLNGKPQHRPLVPCDCAAPTRPGLVLDPFIGSGTTAVVARELKRDYLGIELNPSYAALAEARLGIQPGLRRAA